MSPPRRLRPGPACTAPSRPGWISGCSISRRRRRRPHATLWMPSYAMPSRPSHTMVLWPQRRSVCASVCRSGAEAVGSALACRLLLPPSAHPSVLRASDSSTPGWRTASRGLASSPSSSTALAPGPSTLTRPTCACRLSSPRTPTWATPFRMRGLFLGRRLMAWWMSRGRPACLATRPRRCPRSTGCSTLSRPSVRQQLPDVSMSSCLLSPGRTHGGTRGWRLGIPLRLRVVGSLRTPPSASAWCVRAASSARCLSPTWVWIAQRLRPQAFWAPRSRDTAVGVSGSSSMPEVGRSSVCMPGDGWRDAHDYIASTVFDLVSLAGISGTMEPRGIFSMAVPAEVLAAAQAKDGSRRSRPGAVPDYCFTVDGRRMLYDVKRISFCPSRYWPTVAVASSRGGALE